MSYAKIKIEGTIEIKTGLHIGGDDSFSAIGAIDSPVIRDPYTHLPIIPGSSFKGKMRTLLARDLGSTPGPGVKGFKNDDCRIKRLFGKGGSEDGRVPFTRLQFSDCFMTNKEKLPQITETKTENTIDRLTCVANPRKMERVIRGAEFGFEIIYNMDDEAQLTEDFELIQKGFDLLRNDYLGGGGTRGNGRIDFRDVRVKVVTGNVSVELPTLR